MAFINSIGITKFRGIQKLEVSEFSNINLIVGDNNSGKTTFLEAIQLLFAKSQLLEQVEQQDIRILKQSILI